MMGPEEVLIRGENVTVNGRLVPEGASQLLPGKAGGHQEVAQGPIHFSGTVCLSAGRGSEGS